MSKPGFNPSAKSTVKKRTVNAAGKQPAQGAPFNAQDPKRRLGNFDAAGEHARQGGRKSGIVGQRKRDYRADK